MAATGSRRNNLNLTGKRILFENIYNSIRKEAENKG
jgi:hypothetical protein